MSWNFVRFHEILFQTDAESFSILSWKTKKFYSLKKILGRIQYQNKKALFTDPIFSDSFGFYNIGVGVPHCPIARILGPRKNHATQNT